MMRGRGAYVRLAAIFVIACSSSEARQSAPDARDIDPDAAIDPDAVDASPDAPETPQDIVALCGAVPATLADWEACYLRRYCAALVNCSEQNLYTDVQECVAMQDA